MFPAKQIRDNLDSFRQACAARRVVLPWERFLALDGERRRLVAESEERRRLQKELSGKVAELGPGRQAEHPLVLQARGVSDDIRRIEQRLGEVDAACREFLAKVPNPPHASVPVGDASANRVVRSWGEPPVFDFAPLPHWEIGERKGIIDFARGAKVSGSSFPVFAGTGARLVRALMTYFLEAHASAGFSEVWVPSLVNRDAMFGTGQLPNLEDDMYRLERDDFFLIPTAEVPVTNLFRDEVIPEDRLPLFLSAYTPCFRREAGAYGRDTRGLVRVHQFDKVELVKLVKPGTSYEELESLVGQAELVLRNLGIPHRVVLLASGDLSFAASKCYDIEVWAAGLGRWLEVSSCSNFEDFQARRANIRYRPKSGKVEHLHTLNGSGVAFPRTLIALLENGQRRDGSVAVPEVLRPFLGGMESF